MKRLIGIALLGASAVVAASAAIAQTLPPQMGAAPRPPNFPSRQVDAAAAERGKALYVNNSCAFCHGADIRGGDGGPNLRRSSIVLNDQRGEKIGVVVKNGVKGTAMPAFSRMTDAQVADIAEYLHSFAVSNGGGIAERPKSILVGDAAAGRAYFQRTCAACHTAGGDLAHLATRYPDPLVMQQAWLAPAAKQPVTAVVTLADGSKVTGRALKIDEFSVTLAAEGGGAGPPRVIPRDGDKPKVEIDDPLAPHSALLRRYADKDIHDLTAYLVSLK
jgi:mono/diheme cytochrome c family protein